MPDGAHRQVERGPPTFVKPHGNAIGLGLCMVRRASSRAHVHRDRWYDTSPLRGSGLFCTWIPNCRVYNSRLPRTSRWRMGHRGAVGSWVHPPSTSHLGKSKLGPVTPPRRAQFESKRYYRVSKLPRIALSSKFWASTRFTFVGRFRTYPRRSVPKITFMVIFSTAVSSKPSK